ncbi:hypothetical protein DXG01_012677 [Tephrocybe rancida]|nr:hypothetical protein DXG01_012677 [Tephrocybe rancida]
MYALRSTSATLPAAASLFESLSDHHVRPVKRLVHRLPSSIPSHPGDKQPPLDENPSGPNSTTPRKRISSDADPELPQMPCNLQIGHLELLHTHENDRESTLHLASFRTRARNTGMAMLFTIR